MNVTIDPHFRKTEEEKITTNYPVPTSINQRSTLREIQAKTGFDVNHYARQCFDKLIEAYLKGELERAG